MDTRRGIIAVSGLFLFSTSATRFVAHDSRASSSARREPVACNLLTAADASKALEVSSGPGKPLDANSTGACIWSNDPAASDTSRKVALVIHTPRAFDIAKRTTVTTIKIEPVAGIGDEAFYQVYPSGSPFIWVRKGAVAISIRILTRQKPTPPFTVDQEKSKEAVLAKAAVAKL